MLCTSNGLLRRGFVIGSTCIQPAASVHHHLERHNLNRFLGIARKGTRRSNRHYNPKFRRERGLKFLEVHLPDISLRDDPIRNEAALRREMLLNGLRNVDLEPSRVWKERNIAVTSMGEVLDPYVPSEFDEKTLFERTKGLPNTLMLKYRNRVSRLNEALLKSTGSGFDEAKFLELAVDLYKKANEALQVYDDKALFDYVTEGAYVEMLEARGQGSIRWKWHEQLSAPEMVKVVNCTQEDLPLFQFFQITVRLHSKQSLAVYDQFGRLLAGSETTPVDVVDYVVYENMITDPFGKWRILSKLRYDARKTQSLPLTTRRVPDEEEMKRRNAARRRDLYDAMNVPTKFQDEIATKKPKPKLLGEMDD